MKTFGGRVGAAFVGAAVVVLGAGCGHAQPQPFGSFPRDIDTTRVFAAYRQQQTTRSQPVTLAADARYVRVRIECANDDGWVKVRVAGKSGAMGCGPTVSGGSIDFRNTKGARGALPLKIQAPKGSTWSVAVETRRTPFLPLTTTG